MHQIVPSPRSPRWPQHWWQPVGVLAITVVGVLAWVVVMAMAVAFGIGCALIAALLRLAAAPRPRA